MTRVRDSDVEAARALVRRTTGLTSSGRDVATAMRRVMTAEQRREPSAYVGSLETDAGALDALIAELTIGETYFLREREQLHFLRTHVIPRIARGSGVGKVRVWSAGCASGEEAYTLAMLFQEAGLGERTRILGTDIARDRLRRARKGHYGRWSFRGVPDAIKHRYFRVGRNTFDVAPELRAMVEFRHLNLLDADYGEAALLPGSTDLVLCRNVLIYLDRDSVEHVVRRLLDALSPDGWLLLGASDPYLVGMVPCEAVVTGAGIIYRRPAAHPVSRPAFPAPARPRVPARAGVSTTPAPPAVSGVQEARPTEPDPPRSVEAEVARVRALADRGTLSEAGRECTAALERHADCAELVYLQALLLVEAGRDDEAAAAARRALYLDRRLAVAHLLLGGALARLGRTVEARRGLQTAQRLLAELPADAPVPGSGGATREALHELARAQLGLLNAAVP